MSIPSSWYFCLESSEIRPNEVLGRSFFGQELVFWRTESGMLHCSTATCPHRGSDLSKLGRVQGENLECFSHRYQHDARGDCVKTGLPILPCRPEGALRMFPVHEIAGFVLVWFDTHGKEPTWTIPDRAFESRGTGRFIKSQFTFDCTVETINEDNFDVGHLYQWHALDEVDSTLPQVDGPTISVVHDFRRHSILFGKKLPKPFDVLSQEVVSRYGSTLYGHGLTWSFIDLDAFDFHVQDFIFATPIDAETTLYTTFLRRVFPKTKPGTWLERAKHTFHPVLFAMFVWRLRQEHRHEGHGFWENQKDVRDPIITDTERAMLEPYWEWCRQFDPDGLPRAQAKEPLTPKLCVVASS